jgi:hypothetical protein
MDGLSREISKAGRYQRACLDLLREHEAEGSLPTSIRFLFYELLDRGMVPKTYPEGTRTPSQDIADAVKRLREVGLVSWDWIVDETRTLYDWRYAGSVYQYVEDTLPLARIDVWEGEKPPLILCESRSLAGVLRTVAQNYLCPIAATNGQVGGFLHTDIAPLVKGGRRVFYLGDLDLSGGQIEQNTRKVLSAYGPIDWGRVAITPEQLQERTLPIIQKPDRRYNPPRRFPAVETESLGQAQIIAILTSKLEEATPEPLEDVLEREELQRVLVRELLRSEADDEGEGD